jgi:hypothetical protein
VTRECRLIARPGIHPWQIFSTADRSLAGKSSKIFSRRQIFIQIFENLGLPQTFFSKREEAAPGGASVV